MSVDTVLIFVEHTVGTRVRSGVQRVVLELCCALLDRVSVQLVKWDAVDGQLRYLNVEDIELLFNGKINPLKLVNSHCHRVNYRFDDTIADAGRTWLLFPEIPYFITRGNERFSRIISQCNEYGIRIAAIFYDLIPIRDKDYEAGRAEHLEYVAELSRCERILCISAFSADDLRSFYRSHEQFVGMDTAALIQKIEAVPLGEYREGTSWGISTAPAAKLPAERSIAVLGTVEPRKQQIRFLRIFNDSRAAEPLLDTYSIEVIGSLHPMCASALHGEIARNSRIHYHQYSSDAFIDQVLQTADFSVFISRSEGYGLPIVESLSDEAIAADLLALVRDDQLRLRLRREIAARPRRSWGDYADYVLKLLFRDLPNRAAVSDAVMQQLLLAQRELSQGRNAILEIDGISWHVCSRAAAQSDADHEFPMAAASANTPSAALIDLSYCDIDSADDEFLRRIGAADLLVLGNRGQEARLMERMRNREIARLLPEDHCDTGGLGIATDDVVARVIAISRDKQYAAARARKEDTFAKVARGLKRDLPKSRHELAIIVSTYNRGPFTELNVKWLLHLTRNLRSRVCIVVVDNASTDDTAQRLEKYRGFAHFDLHSNPANVGMLGNLHVTSTLELARHVWTIGDDDFIRPGAIERVLEVAGDHPRVPLIAHNFAVYYRRQLAAGDSPERFAEESTPLCGNPSPTGMMSVRALAEQHDNLFTAIYPLVFRSDIAAACFNYPFEGYPFGDLIESVPTTKIVLESLANCQGYWVSELGITGNAHNSWSVHRPRWHLVLMPRVLLLARRRGLDPSKLWHWGQIHLDLFFESLDEAKNSNKGIHLSAREIEQAEWFFQRKIQIPDGIRTYAIPPVPLWSLEA
jgi:glycosyltransferase involved in cell wall biosynthesis